MIIRKTKKEDILAAAEIYDKARAFMKQAGNPTQWSSGHPNADDIEQDIADGTGYVWYNAEARIRLNRFGIYGISSAAQYKIRSLLRNNN